MDIGNIATLILKTLRDEVEGKTGIKNSYILSGLIFATASLAKATGISDEKLVEGVKVAIKIRDEKPELMN